MKSSLFGGHSEREPPGTMFNLEFIFIDNLILEIQFLVHTFRNRISKNRVRIDDFNGQIQCGNITNFVIVFFRSLSLFSFFLILRSKLISAFKSKYRFLLLRTCVPHSVVNFGNIKFGVLCATSTLIGISLFLALCGGCV